MWDYPRPPRVEPSSALVEVVLGGDVIASTTRAVRVLETSSPPVYYLPRDDVAAGVLQPADGATWCEWKGRAVYFDAVCGDVRAERAAWSYPTPTEAFAELQDWLAFYPGRVDACFVDGERVRPQPGRYYGGWITDAIVGPFKGDPGTQDW